MRYAFLLVLAGCGSTCNVQPLPGPLPADQTIEGGGQIRVTPAGFTKLTSVIPAAITQLTQDGVCIPQGSWGDPSGSFGTGTYYCDDHRGGACGSGNGCDVQFHLDLVDLGVPDEQHLQIHVQLDLHTIVHLDYQVVGASGSCDMHVDGNNVSLTASIVFGIDPQSGELDVHLDTIDQYDLSGVQFSNCGAISSFGNFARDFVDSWFGQWVVDYLTPQIDGLIHNALPDPLGLEGEVDVGSYLGGISPGTEATLEARIVAGGYVKLRGGGLSLGLVTGLNSDSDPTTRSADLDSEPAYCVPPIAAPDFSQPPASLPRSARGTFTLAPAGEFLGSPDPADDLVMGISETTLDLAGHHLVTSGAMCLGVGTRLIPQLTLGTFSLLVPSLGTLGDATNPVLLVMRPQRAVDFAVGAGTSDSPSVTATISDLEIDVYVFLYERYVRAFTMSLDLSAGVNLTFDQPPGEAPTITPELVGLDADHIQVAVLNSEFVAESPADLEQVLPTVVNLAVGLLGDLPSIDVPSFGGFTLSGLRLAKATTNEDDFLAIYASLGTANLTAPLHADAPDVKVISIDTPPPRSATYPTITLAVPGHDASGRPLEHAWSFGGMWRPYRAGDTLTISDPALAWQGKYTIAVRSRVVGDYRTTSATTEVPLVIDSVAPAIALDRASEDGGALTVPATDLVSTSLQWAWGSPGDQTPETDWSESSTLDAATRAELAIDGAVEVFVRDEAGNVAHAAIGFHGAPGTTGCGCDSGAPDASGALVLFVAFALVRRRRSAPARA